MSLRHSLLALLVVVIWGGNFVIIDVGQQDVPPLLFLAMRFLVVCVPAIFFLKPPGIGWRQLLVVGMGGLTLVIIGHAQAAPSLPLIVTLGADHAGGPRRGGAAATQPGVEAGSR